MGIAATVSKEDAWWKNTLDDAFEKAFDDANKAARTKKPASDLGYVAASSFLFSVAAESISHKKINRGDLNTILIVEALLDPKSEESRYLSNLLDMREGSLISRELRNCFEIHVHSLAPTFKEIKRVM